MAYAEFYPDFVCRFHHSVEAKTHAAFPLLERLADRGAIELRECRHPTAGLSATTWRMQPMWDPEVSVFFCRDVDAVPAKDEIAAKSLFLPSKYLIHGIRSHPNHSIRLLAGLCGFKAARLRPMLAAKSFDEYVAHGASCGIVDWQWGCDQTLLQSFFYARHRLQAATLDSPVNFANKTTWPNLPQRAYDDVSFDCCQPELLKECCRLAVFAGNPIACPTESTKLALSIGTKMADTVAEAASLPGVKEYYRL